MRKVRRSFSSRNRREGAGLVESFAALAIQNASVGDSWPRDDHRREQRRREVK
jgi:hypothetical protein